MPTGESASLVQQSALWVGLVKATERVQQERKDIHTEILSDLLCSHCPSSSFHIDSYFNTKLQIFRSSMCT